MKTIISSLALCAALISSGANAALESRLGGLAVYDTDRNITWLANANLAVTETFGVSGINANNGTMNWYTAQSWIGAMNTSNYLGYHDWRLPTVAGSSICNWDGSGLGCGYNVNTSYSEMAHLFYDELGNKAIYSSAGVYQDSGYGLVDDPANPNDESLFTNLQSRSYWNGTMYADIAGFAWEFNFGNGGQSRSTTDGSTLFALVVRPGDIGAVPVPAAAWLLGSGLLGLIGVARRKAA